MKLSVITICLNEERNIEQTIKSVLGQTFTDFEYIIVDGGSTDGTLDIIQRYRERIDIVLSEKDSGIYNAMNKGINLANGEYLLFINSGDYILNDNVLEKALKNENGEDIIYGDGVLISGGKLIRKPSSPKPSAFFMFFDTIPHQSSLIKKELFDKIGFYDESLKIAADYDFFLNALYFHSAKTRYVPISFCVNNLLGLSNDKRYRALMYKERQIAQKRYFNKNIKYFFIGLKPIFVYCFKYPRYIFYILSSLIFKSYITR